MTVYLDNAATTLRKPPAVGRAVFRAVEQMTTPGRGSYRSAILAAETAFKCRQAAAELFHVDDPEKVIFTFSATHALNIAIKSLVRSGDRVVVSGYEHNAVTRPLTSLGCRIRVASGPLFNRDAILARFEQEITPETACVICTHVSNVFGFILPVDEISALCSAQGVPFILDASQSAGALPVHMDELGSAFAAMPGHKGLYGPQGTGLLLCGTEETHPILEGGTGSLSARGEMPDFLPDRLEAGTHNIPGIAGLLEGLRFVLRRGEEDILRYERDLVAQTAEELRALHGVTVFASPEPELQSGVLSFLIDGLDCEEVGELLGRRGIAVRAGLHCAPYAHSSAGTLETGTIRVSFSTFNSTSDGRKLAGAVREILR